MEQKKKEQKTAQILYISILMVLMIMAVIVGVVNTANKRNRPAKTSDVSTSASTPVSTSASVREIEHTAPSVTTAQTSASTPATQPPKTVTEPTTEKPKTAKPSTDADAPISVLPEFIMPTIGSVSKTFTVDTLVYSNTMEDYRTHNGIDICGAVGEAVMAAADGIVTKVYDHPMMGTTVVIAHDGNAETVYQNLAAEVAVSVGDSVKCGSIIGAIGDTALIEIAEEPHLHFEMQVNGALANPLDYIAAATMTVIYEDE